MPQQPAQISRASVPRGQHAGTQSPAQPLSLFRPPGDLSRADRLVLQAHRLLPRPVRTDELGEDAPRQLGSHAALTQPDAQVDLFGPEILDRKSTRLNS